jgi:hypothetical protein
VSDKYKALAERELSALLCAVRINGLDPLQCAADLWLAALEVTPCSGGRPESFFRNLSIQVVTQLIALGAPLDLSYV